MIREQLVSNITTDLQIPVRNSETMKDLGVLKFSCNAQPGHQFNPVALDGSADFIFLHFPHTFGKALLHWWLEEW